MIVRGILTIVVIINCLCFFACTSDRSVVKGDANHNTVNIIALLPVENHTADARASEMLRTKLNNELRFKGYPEIATDVVDRKLMLLAGGNEAKPNGAVSPKDVEGMLGADAAMYCILQESSMSTTLFYAPVTVSVRCELRSTHTGEMLWNAQHKTTNRSFDFIRARLKMKSLGDLESAMEEVVAKVMQTLPNGPKLRG